MSYFGVSLRNGVGLGLGTVPSLTNTPLSYRLAPSLDLSFAGSDALSPAITFSRTTNATVTGSNGLIQNAPMNLLTFSEQFDNAAWGKTAATVTANATAAPNGTTTADTVVATAVSGYHGVSFGQALSASVMYTVSIFAKSSGYTNLSLSDLGNGVFAARFDLSAVSVISTVAGTTATITDVGNGWRRCTATFTALTAGFTFAVVGYPAGATLNQFGAQYTGDGTSGIYVWGAQLELGSTATTYNPTTVKNLLGFTENFDNAAWTKSNAFVQTNLLLQSEGFGTASWAASTPECTITANASTAPNGSSTAALVVPNTTVATHRVLQSVSTSTSAHTYSCFLKAAGYSKFLMFLNGPNQAAVVDLTAQTITAFTKYAAAPSNLTLTSVGNGWFRASLTTTIATAISLAQLQVYSDAATPDNTYAGDGISGVLLWGAQLVQGTSAGDYKATYATAAAVGYTDIYGQPFAQKLVEDTVLAGHFVFQSAAMTAGTSYTASVYAKQGERRYMFLRFFATGAFAANRIAIFDLQEGTAVPDAGNAPASFSITPVGNGYYRCSITNAASTTGTGSLGVFTSANGLTSTYTGDGTSGIYIFGAQLSDSASVDPYVYQPVAAPTSTAYYGPRFDYDPVTLAPKGLLIEEQRTNLFTYSEQFDNADWTKGNTSITANTVVAPDGTLTGDALVENTANTTHVVFQNKTVSAGTFTASVYAKAAGRTKFQFSSISGGFPGATFDLTAATATVVGSTTSASITSVGNGWFRCTATRTLAAGTDQCQIRLNDAAGASTYTGDGTSGIYIWGAQLEAGAFATSYIPTVASQVTRAADSASMIGNNFARWYVQGVGTLFANFNTVNQGSIGVAALTGAAPINNRIMLYQNGSFTNYQAQVINSGSTEIQQGIPATVLGNNKFALGLSTNNSAVSGNGSVSTTDTSCIIPTTDITNLIIGAAPFAGVLNGTIARLAFYPRRLANTELTSITS
jgi:hypothetical protein